MTAAVKPWFISGEYFDSSCYILVYFSFWLSNFLLYWSYKVREIKTKAKDHDEVVADHKLKM